MEKKKYSLIVSGDSSFSLICDADQDAMTDYFPGLWGIKTQKSAIKFAKEELAEGNEVLVRNYNNANYYALSNKLIKALGTNQPLFKEPEALVSSVPTNGKPATLSELKRYLTVGKKIKINNYTVKNERETIVLATQTSSVILEKIAGTGIKSWLELGKASEWVFTNESASKYYTDRDGKKVVSSTITYLD